MAAGSWGNFRSTGVQHRQLPEKNSIAEVSYRDERTQRKDLNGMTVEYR